MHTDTTETTRNIFGSYRSAFKFPLLYILMFITGVTLSASSVMAGDITIDGAETFSNDQTFGDITLTIDTDEDVVFEQNVTFDGTTVVFTQNAGGNLIVHGDITVSDTDWEYASEPDVWNFDVREDGNQTVSAGNGSYLLVYNFRADKENGDFELHSEQKDETVLRVLNNFRTDFSGAAIFRDNSTRFIVGDDIRIRGESDSYDLTGTLEHRVHDGNSDYEIVVPELYNLYVHVREDGNPRFRDEQGEDGDDDFTREITINGDFTVDMESTGDFEFNDVILDIGGSFDLTHHRPEEGHDDGDGEGEIDIDDAVITTGGDAIVRLSKDLPDGDENIDVDDGDFNVGGNLYIFAENNGEFDFDGSEFTVDGYAEITMTDGGIVDMDESVFTVQGDLTVDINSVEDFEFGEAVVSIGGDFSLTHHRPEGADGDGEIDGDEAIIEIGGDFIVTLTKHEADGDENIDVDDAEVTVRGNLYVFLLEDGEFDFDDSQFQVDGYALFDIRDGGIADMDESDFTVNNYLRILIDETGEVDTDDLDEGAVSVGGDLLIDLIGHDDDSLVDTSKFDVAGEIIITDNAVTAEETTDIPEKLSLEQNYPNPFNSSTVITYELQRSMHVTLTVYDVLGRKVRVLVDETHDAGRHDISWDAERMSSGIYIYRLQSGEQSLMRTMTLVK